MTIQRAAKAASSRPQGREEAASPRPRGRSGSQWAPVVRACQYLALGILIVVVALSSIIPAVMGWAPLTILTGSMAPTIPSGSLTVVAPVDETRRTELPVGEVITYMPHPDSDELVTHRIILRNTASDGTVSYTTKGDANDGPDPAPVLPKQIRARLCYSVPLAGHLLRVISPDIKRIGRVVGVVALLLYAAWQIAVGYRERGACGRADLDDRGRRPGQKNRPGGAAPSRLARGHAGGLSSSGRVER